MRTMQRIIARSSDIVVKAWPYATYLVELTCEDPTYVRSAQRLAIDSAFFVGPSSTTNDSFRVFERMETNFDF